MLKSVTEVKSAALAKLPTVTVLRPITFSELPKAKIALTVSDCPSRLPINAEIDVDKVPVCCHTTASTWLLVPPIWYDVLVAGPFSTMMPADETAATHAEATTAQVNANFPITLLI